MAAPIEVGRYGEARERWVRSMVSVHVRDTCTLGNTDCRTATPLYGCISGWGDRLAPSVPALIPILDDIGFMDEVSLVLDGFFVPTGHRLWGATTITSLGRQLRSWTWRRIGFAGGPMLLAATAGAESSTRISTGAVWANGARRARRRSANERRSILVGPAHQAPGGRMKSDTAAAGDRTFAGLTAAAWA